MLCDCCVCDHMFRLFFFKQKTAYEMRISDWSSDVCSSDLPLALASRLGHQLRQSIRTARRLFMFKDLSRRHFLAGSTAAAGALTPGGTAAFAADPLKVGYIHVGPVGDFGLTPCHEAARRAVRAHCTDKPRWMARGE